MATKGRLTMSGRREYAVISYSPNGGRTVGYLPVATCALGDHYLTIGVDGSVREDTVAAAHTMRLFETYAEAQAAIEAWQRQHDERRRDGGE